MAKYMKKPIIIEAERWTGENTEEILDWINRDKVVAYAITLNPSNKYLVIETLEGQMKANVGDYIIKGIRGEFYPCKPDIFKQTYNLIEED